MGQSTKGSGAGLIQLPTRKKEGKEKGRRIPLGRESETRQLVLVMDTTCHCCVSHPS